MNISAESISIFFCFGQPGLLLAAQQKGFDLLELRGEDPRLASLDTLSGEEIPLHFLFRLHGYVVQVGGAPSSPQEVGQGLKPVFVVAQLCHYSVTCALQHKRLFPISSHYVRRGYKLVNTLF